MSAASACCLFLCQRMYFLASQAVSSGLHLALYFVDPLVFHASFRKWVIYAHPPVSSLNSWSFSCLSACEWAICMSPLYSFIRWSFASFRRWVLCPYFAYLFLRSMMVFLTAFRPWVLFQCAAYFAYQLDFLAPSACRCSIRKRHCSSLINLP